VWGGWFLPFLPAIPHSLDSKFSRSSLVKIGERRPIMSNMDENYLLEMEDDRKQASKYTDPEWIEEKMFGEEYHYEEDD